MPRIPQILARPTGPESTGTPTRVSPLRQPQFGTLDPGIGQQIGRAVESAGQGLQRVAQQLHGAETRRRQLKQKTDTQNLLNTFTQQIDTYAAESQQDVDFEAHPARVREYAGALQAQLTESVTDPLIRQVFQAEAGQYLSQVNRVAEGIRFQRTTDEARASVLDSAFYNQQKILEEADPVKRQIYEIALRRTIDTAREYGLATPEALAAFEHGFETQRQDHEVAIALQTTPEAMHRQALAQAGGHAPDPTFPMIRAAELPKVIEQARQLIRQQGSDRRAHEAETLRATEAQQALLATEFRTQLHAIDSTPAQIREVARRMRLAATARAIGEEDYAQMAAQAVTLYEKKMAQPVLTDPEVRQAFVTRLYGTPEGLSEDAIRSAQAAIHAAIAADSLDVKEGQGYLAYLEQARSGGHYSRLPLVQQARQALLLAVGVVEDPHLRQRLGAAVADQINARAVAALGAFHARLQTLAETRGPEAVDRHAFQVMQEVRERFSITPASVLEGFRLRYAPDFQRRGSLTGKFEEAYRRLDQDPTLSPDEKAAEFRAMELYEQLYYEVERTGGQGTAPAAPLGGAQVTPRGTP